MKELIFIKIPSAILSTILPIYLLSLGMNNYDIGLVNVAAVFSSMIASFYFSYKALKERNVRSILFFSLESMTISILILVFLYGKLMIIFSIFIFYFYYNAYLYFLKVYYSFSGRDQREIQSKFEFLGGLFYVFGLLLGFFLSLFFDNRSLLVFSALFFVLGMFFVGGIKIKKLGMLESIDEISGKITEDLLGSLRSLKHVSFKNRYLHLSVFLVFLISSLFESQYQLFLKEIGVPISFIFLIYFFRSSFDMVSYRIAKKVNRTTFFLVVLFTFFIILLNLLKNPFLSSLSKILFSLFFGVSTIYFDSLFLSKSKEEFGTSLIVRNLSSIFGSYLCGVILTIFSFDVLFLISSSLIFPLLYLILRLEEDPEGSE